jgi:hypothetical protein
MDGAHTVESIHQFVEWFKETNPNSDNEKNVLLFNFTGERDVKIYRKLLVFLFLILIQLLLVITFAL